MLPAAIRQPTLWSGTSSLLEWALWRWSLDMPWQWAFRVIHGCFDQQKWWFQHVSTCFNMFQPRNIDTATMTSMVMFKNQVVILKQDSTDILLTRDFCHVAFFFFKKPLWMLTWLMVLRISHRRVVIWPIGIDWDPTYHGQPLDPLLFCWRLDPTVNIWVKTVRMCRDQWSWYFDAHLLYHFLDIFKVIWRRQTPMVLLAI